MTTQTTITIRGGHVYTTMPNPRGGRPPSAEEVAGLHAITALAAVGLRVHYDSNQLTALARDLLDTERFGYAVTTEVRDSARLALGWTAVEGGAPCAG
jgi:hypothetical protein